MWCNYAAVAYLVIIFTLSGCSSQGTIQDSNVKDKVGNSASFRWNELSASDQTFIKALQQSADDVHKKVIELEAILQEMQGQDEYHDAEEMMSETKEDILYHWNRMHNEYKPVHPGLQKVKEEYESLLTDYRNGLAIELEGMETGNPEKMKTGYETTKQAVIEIQKFKQNMDQIVSDKTH